MIEAGDKCTFQFKGQQGAQLHINNFSIKNTITFLDYIMGGCNINVHVAIDFTLSNKDPKEPDSLHYLNPLTMVNNYSEAIKSVIGILENYDSDRMFPTYGFGGKPPGGGIDRVSHCFALNGDIFDPECNGVKGVMNAYFKAINKVQLYGNTQFHHILDYVSSCAAV